MSSAESHEGRKGLEQTDREKWLREVGLLGLQKRELAGHVVVLF